MIRLNEKFIELMEKLVDIMLKQGELFRCRAYQKAQETIMAFSDDILTPNQLKDKPGIGKTILEKLNEYHETGTLKIIEKEKTNPVNILVEVYGIGPKKAKDLVENGIISIAMLRKNQHMLNDIQKVGLKYYEDILKRIPRDEIQEYEIIINEVFKKIGNDYKFEIVGSYRRGAESSGDIDIIITSNSCQVFVKFIDELIKKNIIVEILSRGPSKCLVIAKISSSNFVRRVDFLFTSFEEFPFAILYFTGSKYFNTVMRNIALKKGYTMNEHGLYTYQNKTKGNKVEHVFKNEKDIFDYLELEYKDPNKRIDGRACKEIDEDKKKLNITSCINNFKKNGIFVLKNLNEFELTDILKEANNSYYNTNEPLMTDNEFDIVKEYIQSKYPNNLAITTIGAPVLSRKVALPYFMGSMNKIKPDTSVLTSWILNYKGPYILSCKLDGVSGLYTTENNLPKLYTRGDGNYGQDISHLIPYLRLPKTKGLVIRGEFIILKSIFDAKYKTKFANPRNMVAGIINNKTVNESVIIDLHFVAYELIKPVKKPSEQMSILSTFDLEVVLYKEEAKISNELLSKTLIDLRSNYVYETDGVIVVNNSIYERNNSNPQFAFAFKMVLSDQVAEAKVIDVIWSPSKDGYLKPRVQIEPVNLTGVTIEYLTGFNAAFIEKNKIGVGAIIEIIRSGDVIPYIRKVLLPAEKTKMPLGIYKWNESHIDILLEDFELNHTVKEKVITGFFQGIGVERLSFGNIARIIEAGFDSVPKIIQMSIDDFLMVKGFKEKTSINLYNGIRDALNKASIVTLMASSNIFGRGFNEKKLQLIIEAYPHILISKETNDEKVNKVSSIKGIATKTSEAFVEKIPNFINFLQNIKFEEKLNFTQKDFQETHPLFKKTVVLTGFRDESLEEEIKLFGGKIGSSVSKNTFVVLVKDLTEDTSKVKDAKKNNISIMTLNQFILKYDLKKDKEKNK